MRVDVSHRKRKKRFRLTWLSNDSPEEDYSVPQAILHLLLGPFFSNFPLLDRRYRGAALIMQSLLYSLVWCRLSPLCFLRLSGTSRFACPWEELFVHQMSILLHPCNILTFHRGALLLGLFAPHQGFTTALSLSLSSKSYSAAPSFDCGITSSPLVAPPACVISLSKAADAGKILCKWRWLILSPSYHQSKDPHWWRWRRLRAIVCGNFPHGGAFTGGATF